MKKQKYAVSGMTCSACSSHVEKSVGKLKGMEQVSVNLLTNSMQVSYDETSCDEEKIIEAVEKAGYGAELLSSREQQAESSEGSQREEGQNGGKERSVTGNGENRNGREKIKAKKESREMKQRLLVSIIFMVLLMTVSMHHMFFGWLHLPVPPLLMKLFHGNENALTFAFTQMLLTMPIIYVNRKYFQTGFKTLLHGSPNMDSLIAIGSGAAFIYGIFAIYRIGYGLGHGDMELVSRYSSELYFESAGMILALITIGKYMETRSKGKTGEAIEKLMDLSPKTAVLLLENGEEREVPAQQIKKGDVFVVRPGSLLPVDGVVLEGTTSVNEAAITGESIPVEKQPGDSVVSATMNQAGRIICRAEKVGEDTTLSQIIRLVEEAASSKAPIAKLADKVAGIFVPVVMGIAAITFLAWIFAGESFEQAMSSAIAVLVISCPCALGLATPVAIMVGTGVGAKNGILIKSGDALQSAGKINTVVLDKTGTITEGKPKVTDIVSYRKGLSEEQILSYAAAVEKPSEHPLSEAIVKEAVLRKLRIPTVQEFQAVFGKGVKGVCEGKPCLAGNRRFMEENGIMLNSLQEKVPEELSNEGKTPLLFAMDGKLAAVIAVADTVKASSRDAIAAFHQMKIDVVMLTGDNKRTAEAVQKDLGMNQVIAEVLPKDKEKEIRRLQKEGRRVAMVGDGINDAPALAAAEVGIAIGAGTDVAIESADIILMKSRLTDVITAIRLSRAVIRNIKENLFWAFFYNVIGIPLAAGIWYPTFGLRLTPMFGAAAMSFSSLFVVGNALRLRNFKSDLKEQEQKEQSENGTENTVTETGRGAGDAEAENCNARHRKEDNMKKIMIIEGMACGHCTARVQKALEEIEGVEGVDMSLEEKSAEITLSKEVSDELLTAAVTDAGYEVVEIR